MQLLCACCSSHAGGSTKLRRVVRLSDFVIGWIGDVRRSVTYWLGPECIVNDEPQGYHHDRGDGQRAEG